MDMRDSPSAWEPGAKGPHPEFVAQIADAPASDSVRLAKFGIGQVVKHRVFSFRGVIFDVDPVFANTEEWWEAIPAEVRPHKDQPFYHLLAENEHDTYVAYVSEANLAPDDSGRPLGHPQIPAIFSGFEDGHYLLRPRTSN